MCAAVYTHPRPVAPEPPGLQASRRPGVCRMSRRGKGGAAQGPTLGQQLTEITLRMDHLERFMMDLTPEGSTRVIDRMHELEHTTRKQCNDLLTIMRVKGDDMNKTFLRAELLVIEAEAKCENLEHILRRRGEKERQETTAVLNELRNAIETIDLRASSTVQELEAKLQQAGSQILSMQKKVFDVTLLCDKAEAAAAQAQMAADRACSRQLAEWSSPQELKAQVVARARSVQPGGAEVGWLVSLAQEAAARSPRRAVARLTASSQQQRRGRSRGPMLG